jgi:hypothetical protein
MKKKQNENESIIRTIHGFFAMLSFLIVMVGETILYTSTTHPEIILPTSLWICLVGVILFLASLLIRPPRFLQTLFLRLRIAESVFWILAAFALSLLTTYAMVLFRNADTINFMPVLTIWFAAGIIYVAVFSWNSLDSRDWREWLKAHRTELIWLGVIFLFAIAVRFYKLGELPRIIDGDEGRMGLAAKSSTTGRLANPFALWENFGGLYLQLMNLCMNVFGTSPFSLRMLSAIGGVLAIPATYLLAKQIAGTRVGLISTAVLAFSHTHINFSRIAPVGYIQDTWLVPLELYLLLSGLQKRSTWRTALAGVILAVHFSVYLTSQTVVVLLLIYTAVAFLFLRGWIKPAWRQVLAFWGGLGIMLLPEIYYALTHSNEFFSRLSADGTFQSGWLAKTMASTGQSAIHILADRILHSFLSLIYYPAFDFYGSPVPMLTLVAAALFLVGMGICLWRTRSPGYLLLNGYFYGLMFAIGIFAIPPSADSYRMLMVLPAAVIMAAIGLDQLLQAIGLGWETKRVGYSLATGFVLLSLLTTNLWTYYGDFAGRCLYGGDLQGRFASYLGSYAHTVRPEDSIILLSDDIYFYGSHASVDFLSQGRKITNLKDPVDTLQPQAGDTIIASPNRFAELQTWAIQHPGGELHFFYDCTKIIMISYQFP